MKINKEEFIAQYNIVFDKNDKIKNCGRDACKKLIALANEITPKLYFGDENTGFLEIDSIQKLKELL